MINELKKNLTKQYSYEQCTQSFLTTTKYPDKNSIKVKSSIEIDQTVIYNNCIIVKWKTFFENGFNQRTSLKYEH